MSDEEIEMLRHATGADSVQPGYRSHYCTESDDPVALSLVAAGLFDGPKYGGNFGPGCALFYATARAFRLLGLKGKE